MMCVRVYTFLGGVGIEFQLMCCHDADTDTDTDTDTDNDYIDISTVTDNKSIVYIRLLQNFLLSARFSHSFLTRLCVAAAY